MGRSAPAVGFWRRLAAEDGGNAAVVFALTLLPLLGGAGLAIDSILGYTVEQQLQRALDAGGLAAGSAPLPENVQADAKAYFDSNFNAGPKLATARDFKAVVDGDTITLTASATMPTRFMRLFGRDALTVNATTVVLRQVRQMELALVLDNTGSMAGAAFTAMQSAARDLVDIVYGDAETQPNLWVAVVPFVSTVNIGPQRTAWLDPADQVFAKPDRFAPTTWKGCVMARTGGLDQTDDPPSAQRFRSFLYPKDVDNDWGVPRSPAVDDKLASGNNGYGPNLGCGPPLTPLIAKKSDVKAALNAMGAWSRGGTAGNEGLAWGWRVLSPRWRGLWGGTTPPTRPLDYDAQLTDKVAVVLTDGQNQAYDWACEWKAGSNTPDCNGKPDGPRGSDYTAFGRLLDFMPAGSSLEKGRDELDKRQKAICTAMKAKGIVVYSITFGATPDAKAQALYKACASRPDYYFHAPTNASLRTVFRTIGVQLSNLRIVR